MSWLTDQPRGLNGQYASWQPLETVGRLTVFLLVPLLLLAFLAYATHAGFRERVDVVWTHLDQCGLDFTTCSPTTVTVPPTTTLA